MEHNRTTNTLTLFTKWRESPTDLGQLFVPIIAKGQVYPLTENTDRFCNSTFHEKNTFWNPGSAPTVEIESNTAAEL